MFLVVLLRVKPSILLSLVCFLPTIKGSRKSKEKSQYLSREGRNKRQRKINLNKQTNFQLLKNYLPLMKRKVTLNKETLKNWIKINSFVRQENNKIGLL